MNVDTRDDDPLIYYYDSDCPSEEGPYPENFAGTSEYGVRFDVQRYREFAKEAPNGIVVPFCGTGRVLLPLARDGHVLTGIDISGGMLAQCRKKIEREPKAIGERVRLIEADVRGVDTVDGLHDLAVVPFNSLLCVTDFDGQLAALAAVRRFLRLGGKLIVDITNPSIVNPIGDPVGKPFFRRRCLHNGNLYTRYMSSGPFDGRQVQQIWGWYDEVQEDGSARKSEYAYKWRLIYRFEMQLMLEKVGFRVEALEGGCRGEPYQFSSARMLYSAVAV